jgi:hypothetical protein
MGNPERCPRDFLIGDETGKIEEQDLFRARSLQHRFLEARRFREQGIWTKVHGNEDCGRRRRTMQAFFMGFRSLCDLCGKTITDARKGKEEGKRLAWIGGSVIKECPIT